MSKLGQTRELFGELQELFSQPSDDSLTDQQGEIISNMFKAFGGVLRLALDEIAELNGIIAQQDRSCADNHTQKQGE